MPAINYFECMITFNIDLLKLFLIPAFLFSVKFSYDVDPSDYECTSYEEGINYQFYTYASGVVPLIASPVLTWVGNDPNFHIVCD